MPTAATTRFVLAAALALLCATAPARAAETVKITAVTVGLPAGTEGVAKFGAWAPVYVTLELQGAVDEPAELVIESPDADEVSTTLAVPLNLAGLAPGASVFAPAQGATGYVRPCGSSSEVTVSVRTAKGAPLSAPYRVRPRPREPLQYVVLAVGAAPAGFELPKPPTSGAEVGPLRNGRVELAHVADLARLPDQWFGYGAADLVLLNTSDAALLSQLFGPPESRKREALLEWVRRGGRLVVSVGASAKAVTDLPRLQRVLPYAINPKDPARVQDVAALYWLSGAASTTTMSGAIGAKGGPPFPMANLVRAERPARVLIPPVPKADAPQTVAAQAAYGLGRVTVVGFDLDRPLFAEPGARAEFWDWVLREGGAPRASAGGDGKVRPVGALTEDEDEIAVALRTHNDTFDGVAVVSFGWIAVLIVLYILLIGPIEYYFLKRVFGRLELTWVTFPVIVLTVSAAAYLSADAVKGRELKVNKVDVVDVDPETDRLYGTTWFTVFSPKIDTYTIGVEPGTGWGHFPVRRAEYGTVDWLGAPRGGRQGLVRRKYAIRADEAGVADGLEGVPIQVWSTKSFSANWSSRLESGLTIERKALVSNLTHPPGDGTKVVGTFEHALPVPVLTDCVAIYAGQAYPLPGGVIVSGEPVRLMLEQGTLATQWLQQNGQLESLLNNAQAYRDRPGQKAGQKAQPQLQSFTGPLPLWGLLFHEAALKSEEGVIARNASLRRLDQSWRLHADNRDEVIVVGRAAPPAGPAEDVLAGPNAPSKLWLKGLPGGDRWKVPGTARQETWVRFYLPVR